MKKSEAEILLIKRRRLLRQVNMVEDETLKLTLMKRVKEINRILDENEVWVCSICKRIQFGYMSQNNAYPVQKDPCCDACNLHYVIPERIKQNGGFLK